MVQRGLLKPEAQQQELVRQLSALLQQLQEYTASLASYKVQRQGYEVRSPLVTGKAGAEPLFTLHDQQLCLGAYASKQERLSQVCASYRFLQFQAVPWQPSLLRNTSS
jgi:hypothetical protein